MHTEKVIPQRLALNTLFRCAALRESDSQALLHAIAEEIGEYITVSKFEKLKAHLISTRIQPAPELEPSLAIPKVKPRPVGKVTGAS